MVDLLLETGILVKVWVADYGHSFHFIWIILVLIFNGLSLYFILLIFEQKLIMLVFHNKVLNFTILIRQY